MSIDNRSVGAISNSTSKPSTSASPTFCGFAQGGPMTYGLPSGAMPTGVPPAGTGISHCA